MNTYISHEPSMPVMLIFQASCSQARPWEVIPGHTPAEEAPPRTPSDQPIRGFEPRAPVPPGRPPPYPGSPPARRAPRGGYPPGYEQVLCPTDSPGFRSNPALRQPQMGACQEQSAHTPIPCPLITCAQTAAQTLPACGGKMPFSLNPCADLQCTFCTRSQWAVLCAE